jgi:hypothetical protein
MDSGGGGRRVKRFAEEEAEESNASPSLSPNDGSATFRAESAERARAGPAERGRRSQKWAPDTVTDTGTWAIQ